MSFLELVFALFFITSISAAYLYFAVKIFHRTMKKEIELMETEQGEMGINTKNKRKYEMRAFFKQLAYPSGFILGFYFLFQLFEPASLFKLIFIVFFLHIISLILIFSLTYFEKDEDDFS